jgi:predicted dehydrogenase
MARWARCYFSRIATGRKMGYAYEITGTKGRDPLRSGRPERALALLMDEPEAVRGFRKILTGPAHPDYLPFCQGPGHGTGYQDQIIIEARDFLAAIDTGKPVWPTFRDGLAVNASWRRPSPRHGPKAGNHPNALFERL